MKSIILAKPWGDHASGELVRVDPERAQRLIEEGIGVDAEAHVETPAPKGRKKA